MGNAVSLIKQGQKVPGGKGGDPWLNKGGISKSGNPNQVLPKVDNKGNPITYQEWDVNPKVGRTRDAERIVTGSDGSIWWTQNHYETFTQLE